MLGEPTVQEGTGAGHAVGGQAGLLGPGEVEEVAAAYDAQALVALPAGGVHPQEGELAYGRGGQAVAADLVPAELVLLHQDDVQAQGGQVAGGRGPGRAGTDHDDVRVDPGTPGGGGGASR